MALYKVVTIPPYLPDGLDGRWGERMSVQVSRWSWAARRGSVISLTVVLLSVTFSVSGGSGAFAATAACEPGFGGVSIGAYPGPLYGVTATSPEAWAVGDTQGTGLPLTLIERWDGSAWARVSIWASVASTSSI